MAFQPLVCPSDRSRLQQQHDQQVVGPRSRRICHIWNWCSSSGSSLTSSIASPNTLSHSTELHSDDDARKSHRIYCNTGCPTADPDDDCYVFHQLDWKWPGIRRELCVRPIWRPLESPPEELQKRQFRSHRLGLVRRAAIFLLNRVGSRPPSQRGHGSAVRTSIQARPSCTHQCLRGLVEVGPLYQQDDD